MADLSTQVFSESDFDMFGASLLRFFRLIRLVRIVKLFRHLDGHEKTFSLRKPENLLEHVF